jgi:hypothetical protein
MPRCSATTNVGRQCSRSAGAAGRFCHQHAQAAPAPIPAPRRRQEAEAAIRFAEEQIRRAQLVIAEQRAVIASENENTLADFVRDRENVHTATARDGLYPIYAAIENYLARFGRPSLFRIFRARYDFIQRVRRLSGLPESRTRTLLRTTGVVWFFDHFTMLFAPPALVQLIPLLKEGTTVSRGITRRFEHVLANIIDIAVHLNREDLWDRLAQELIYSQGVCLHGKAMRALNAFVGFEDLIGLPEPVDPRSPSERLGDLFSALRRRELPAEEARAEALRILEAEGVTGVGEQAAWLEAI